MDILIDIGKYIICMILLILAIIGISLLSEFDKFINEVEYYENGIKLEAIEYHNEIYLKKGE